MSTQRSTHRRLAHHIILAVVLALLWPAGAPFAADSITASKEKNPDGTYTTGGTTGFTIATDQVIEWQATYRDTAPAGNDFYLHRPGQPDDEIPLSTTLSGFNGGTHFLSAGTYEISIDFYLMGAGSYTIVYNRTASIGVSPTSHDFGEILTGESTSDHRFTIRSTGDLPVTIDSVAATDPAHFAISDDPSGREVPPDRDFDLRCEGGGVPGSFGTLITVTGSSELGPVSATSSVTCDVLAREPDITCPGTPSLGSADWFLGETLSADREFSNAGTDDLALTSISVVNDTAAGVFTLDGSPSLSALGPGDDRDVAINFTPPASAGEATYSGHLVIHSNDPDEPVKSCPFTARAHHPVPIMRLESTTLDYREVELGFTFTQAVVVHNDGDAPLDLNLANISAGDPDLVHFNLATGAATIDPGDPPVVFRQEFRPGAIGGVYTIQLQLTGNDPSNPSQNLTLMGSGVAPVPIDSVLVLDRSGSMDDPAGARRKIDALQTAADLFTHLLRPDIAASGTGDRLGFVRYNQASDVYLPLDFVEETAAPGSHLAAAEEALSDAALNDIGRLRPDGSTGIGGALETAAGMLVGAPGDRKHVMVALTDGRENEEPWIRDVIGPITAADPELMIYSVGLGSNIRPERLQLITNIANGYHQVADDLSGTTIFDLESFYFKIFVNATGMDLVVDPTHMVPLAGSVPLELDRATINSSDRSATFLVLDFPALRAYYDLELVDPHGVVITLGSSVAGVPVHVLQRHNYTLYKVVFPAAEQASSYVGDWVLRLTPNGSWDPGAMPVKRLSMDDNVGMVIYDPGQGVVPIGFAAAVASDYRMRVEVLPSHYLPGAEVTLTAALSDRGWPMTNGTVEVDVTTPGGIRHDNIALYDDGSHGDVTAADGTWTGRFIQTAEAGSYRFFFHAIGENERGELAPRQATRYLTLQAPSPDPDAEPCIPCNVQWLLWALALFMLFLLIVMLWYCCWRRNFVRVG